MATEDGDSSLGKRLSPVKPCHVLSDMAFSYAGQSQRSNRFTESTYWRAHPKLSQSSSLESDQTVVSVDSEKMSSRPRLESQSSIVDGLLFEIYDRWYDSRLDSFDSDTFTECSSTSEFLHGRRSSYIHSITVGGLQINNLHRGLLEEQTIGQLRSLISEMKRGISQTSAKLVKQLKRRERRQAKLKTNCDIITAIIQASSPKRRIDTKMRFTVEPPPGESAFDQWKDAMKAVARLPLGIPDEFRKKVWLYLADNYVKEIKIDWEKTVKFAFNERSNPDDNKLGLQIVKDLHRTGCSGFSGEDNHEERASLKRILLAYARWNKAVGYCQGFNVIAALLLDVLDRKEDDAFKVMIYLIDCVLPHSYFANNLRALSVDMAVFRDLLKIFPKLSKHLDYLQHAQDQASGGCYEPPLTNVFTMQWFLTLFATCLPKSTVLRVWDSIMLEGSEILLRTALTIWGKLSSRLLTVNSADEFYTLMGDLTQEMLQGNMLDADSMIKHIYTLAPFPFPQLNDLREKYTYNIRPFNPTGTNKKASWIDGAVLPSDEDDLDDEDIEAITCFTGFIPTATSGMKSRALDGDQRTSSVPDFSSLGPGAYGQGPVDSLGVAGVPAYMERMSTDIGALKKQYAKLKQRQRQAHIILSTASAKQQYAAKTKPIVPKIEVPTAVNHLFLSKSGGHGKNRYIAAGPRIANMYPVTQPVPVEHSQKSNQPITPHVVGDTRCKWIQKQKKEPDRTAKTPASPKKSEALTVISETDSSSDRAVNQESNNLKAGKEKNNNDSDVSNKQEFSGSLDDSGLGTSIHGPDGMVSAGANDTEVNQGAVFESEQKTDIVKENAVLENEDEIKISSIGSLGEPNATENSECKRDNSMHHPECPESEEGNITVEDLECLSASDYQCADMNDSGIDIINKRESESGKTEGQQLSVNDDVSESTKQSHNKDDTGVVHEDGQKAASHQVIIGDIKRSQYFKLAVESQEIQYSSAGNINNNCVSDAGEVQNKPKIALANHSSVNADSDKVHKQPRSKSVTEYKGQYAKSESVDLYYSNKKNLAAKSSSFDDHLRTYRDTKKSFNPFPIKHVNTNRAKTGVKLGLYKQSTLDEFERNLRKPVWGK